jgi:glycosyltransferase involved in cell wall biosynthesis
MQLSLFTPTNNTEYLYEAYVSLKLQTVTDWEWVIVPNGNDVTIPEAIANDSRVKVVTDSDNLYNIGALKRKAVDHCSGDVFIEFDHDDLLVPGASLQQIKDKFLEGAGFVYSDTAVFRFLKDKQWRDKEAPKFKEFIYSEQHGWLNYPFKLYGRELKASKCFDVTPRALAEIYYCPDHVRSWSRQAYYAAGGHNPDLPVCDDQELMIKTYLAGFKFAHTGYCNYLYRKHDSNTVILRNAKIQELTQQFKTSYLNLMVKEWVKRNKYSILDLTELRKTGWSLKRDLLQGFGQDRFGHIVANMELQKFKGKHVREFMNAAYKALVPGGYLTIIVPEVHSGMGFGDVEWKSYYSAISMQPYTMKQHARANGKVECRFQQIDCVSMYPSDWHKQNNFKFLKFELCALKGQRQPGIQHI